MPTVELSFTALPAHVRTARLLATAVARRAGVDETLLDEIRLAVGEACSRAVGLHRKHAPAQAVRVRLTDEQDRFTVVVTDTVPAQQSTISALGDFDAEALTRDAPIDGSVPDLLPPGFGLAVISGLVDDLVVDRDGEGTHVRMTWPAADVMAPAEEADH